MRSNPITRFIQSVGVMTALICFPGPAASGKTVTWSQPGHNAAHTGYNAREKTISKSNVGSLALKWDVGTGSEVFFPTLEAGNRIYAVNLAGVLIAVRASDGTTLWSFNAGNSLSGGGIAVDHGKAFVLCVIDSTHAGVCALNAKTGGLLWSWAIYNDGGIAVGSSPYNSPVVHDGMVFMGESDTVDFGHVGYFVALNENDGSLIWQRGNCGNSGNNYCNWIGSNPAAVAKGLVVYDSGFEGSPDAGVCAVSETDGTLAWCFPAVALNQTDHAPSIANGLVYLSETDSNDFADFFALNLQTGAVQWSYASNSSGGGEYYPAAVAKGLVYFAVGGSPIVLAFNAKQGGSPVWQTSILGDSGVSVANGLVYGWNDNGLFALDASNGSQLWSYPTAQRNATPFVVNGAFYGTCNISDICAFALP